MRHSKRAFSLVEMLVATLLISLLLGVAIFAFKYQLMAVHKTQKIGISQALSYHQLRASLESIKFYVVDDYDVLNIPMKNQHFYFNATDTQLKYITENPLFSKDIAVVQINCVNNSLVYKEEELYMNIDFLKPDILEKSQELVLFDRLDKCNFSYYSHLQVYTAFKDSIPEAIHISMTQENIKKEFYITIKSDYNRSLGIINDAVYPLE